ncbi:MAG: ABC transporter permease, partial [Spirochaeta sp.]|nr:ABC transporter permease [Spirochaeta sp.]
MRKLIHITRIVFFKELTELLRDFRTVLISIGVPLVLFPVLVLVLSVNINRAESAFESGIRVGVVAPKASLEVADDAFDLHSYLSHQDFITVISLPEGSTGSQALRAGEISAAVITRQRASTATAAGAPAAASSRAETAAGPGVTLLYDNTDLFSQAAAEYVAAVLDAYSESVLAAQIAALDIPAETFAPLEIELLGLHDPSRSAGTLALSFLIPVLMLVSAALGPLASAADLGAGEKERGTLEPLLGTGAGRPALLLGKFGACAVMGLLGMLAFFTGAGLAYLIGPGAFGSEELQFALSAGTVAILTGLAGATVLVLSSFELALSFLARSAKAAQTYFIPVLIVSSTAGYGTYMMNLEVLSLWYYNIPLFNIALILKAVVLGRLNLVPLLITSVWILLYVAGA